MPVKVRKDTVLYIQIYMFHGILLQGLYVNQLEFPLRESRRGDSLGVVKVS